MCGLTLVLAVTLVVLSNTGGVYCQTYQKECTDVEKHERNCLNGGECFVLQLVEREPSCRCPSRYTGRRCQDLNTISLYGESTLPVNRTVMYGITIGGVLAGFIIGVIITLCISSCYRRRGQANTATDTANDNDHHNGDVVVYSQVPNERV